MRYKTPRRSALSDYIPDDEFAALERRRAPDSEYDARGRANAWREHKAKGLAGQLRDLSCGDIGASRLFTDYKSTPAIGPMVHKIARAERVRFTTRIERSLIDGSIAGVRVTLAGFDE
jgi:hypothetical protein